MDEMLSALIWAYVVIDLNLGLRCYWPHPGLTLLLALSWAYVVTSLDLSYIDFGLGLGYGNSLARCRGNIAHLKVDGYYGH